MNLQSWKQEITAIARYAIRMLDSIELPYKPAIVFDIDFTLLDRYNNIIEHIRMIYYYACMLGITVVIITSRAGTKEVIELTQNIMSSYGLTEIRFWYFRKPDNYNNWSFKRNSRSDVHKRGYTIIMSIGDSDWDITGDYTGIGIKIPRLSYVDDASPLPI